MKDHRFIAYEPDKPLLLPPDIRKWLPEDHLAFFISDMVDSLDLSQITDQYAHENGGHPAYHPAMSYGRMRTKEIELEVEIEALLVEAEALDAAQDMKYGKSDRGNELPEDLRFKTARLEKIKRYKKELEDRVRHEAIDSGKLDEDGNPPPTKGGRGKPPKNPPGIPKPKDQINFTDSESRIMRDGAEKSFVQAYNAQAAVDCDSQIIVAADVTQHANDKRN